MRTRTASEPATWPSRVIRLASLFLLSSLSAAALEPLDDIAALGGGLNHGCALTKAGGVVCWGDNDYGQLGDGTNIDRPLPVAVTGLGSGVAAVATGSYHSCALTSGGGVKCWGNNFEGELGDNSTNLSNVPVDVAGLASGAADVAAGQFHTCALTTGGGVKCWGQNGSGQLGDNTGAVSLVPVDVSGLASGVAQVAAGYDHSCARTTGGALKCWGLNLQGQLGDNSNTNRLLPVDVSGLASGVTDVAAGQFHTCALVAGGGTKCWGRAQEGQVGNGSGSPALVPADVTGLASGVANLDAGGDHNCAALAAGGVKCWGRNNDGQVGDLTELNRFVPVDVLGLAGAVVDIALGGNHSCALHEGGAAKCWGNGAIAGLGDNFGNRATPVDVAAFPVGGSAIASGGAHTCAVFPGGAAKCWGNNDHGQLGTGSTQDSPLPAAVAGLASGVAALESGHQYSCALTTGGGIKCWGRNAEGQLGDNSTTQRNSPVDVAGIASGATALAAGNGHSCAVQGGAALCWGGNANGQLGNDSTAPSPVPVPVTGLASGVTAVVAGTAHACALVSGGVKCWGQNTFGQLGDNTMAQSLVPVDVTGLASGVTAIVAGAHHNCALTASGGAKCWGYNVNGQLGNNGTTTSPVPVDVSGLASGVTTITAGDVHTCALVAGGVVKCWGSNTYGQGGHSAISWLVPQDVERLANGALAISAGGQHTCALTPGGAKCWGYAISGAVGDETNFSRGFPAPILSPSRRFDFDGDGEPDLVWSNVASGATFVWRMQGPALVADAFVATVDPLWKLRGVADFNGDGHPDIVWRNTTDGNCYVWYLQNGAFQSDAFLFSLPPEWVIQGVADFNADGSPDFLMRNVNSGNAFAWYFDDNLAIGDQFLFTIDPIWKVEGVGDVSKDGQPDLLFRNTATGLAFAWNTRHSGGVLSLADSTPPLFGIDPVWEVAQLADVNRDGEMDLVFRNATSGLVFAWYLDRNVLGGSDYFIQIDPSWEIVPRN
ncbi:MAG: FG-GAP-like repeat-containing protein [Burkholderiales bacterium]